MKTAYSYIRFSTTEQQKGDSLRRQIELSNIYAEENGLSIDTTLNLRDLGVSAYDGSNKTKGALGGFIKAVETGIVKSGSYLLVESLDRLSRENVNDALAQFQTIIGNGITIVTLADKKIYSKQSITENPMELIFSILVMARAHEESETKSKRGRAAWTAKRTNASNKILTARCPGWLKVKDDRTGFDFVSENVAVVREILDLTSSGMGQSQIVKIFNKRKQKPFGSGKGWHSSSIQKILTSPALFGDFHLGKYENGKKVLTGEIISDYYPALISKEEFYLIQSGRKLRMEPGGRTKKGKTVSNLFSGLLKCGYCGGGMTLIGSSAKRRKDETGKALPRLGRKAIACQNAIRGLGCWAVQWGYSEFETSFLNFCKDIEIAKFVGRLDEGGQHKSVKLELTDKRRAVEEELSDLRVKRSKLIDVLAVIGASGSEGLMERLNAIEIDIKGKQSLVQQLDIDIVSKDAIATRDISQAKDLKAAIKKMAGLPQDQLLPFRLSLAEHIRNLIEKIMVYPAGLITTHAEYEKIRETLQHAFSVSDLDLFKSLNKTEPLRIGRGPKGRYADKDSGRYFSVLTKNSNLLIISPKKGDATGADIYINANDAEILADGRLSGMPTAWLTDISKKIMSSRLDRE
jgi:DNA invertase Pin-like site-specific DNA recombinase